MNAILIPTVRYTAFVKFLTSLKYLPADWVVYCQVALFTREEMTAVKKHPQFDRVSGVLFAGGRMPPWIARTNILSKYWKQADVWMNADDDMEFIEHTHVQPILDKLKVKGTGMISGNWARAESLLPAKIAKMTNTFIRQPIVFTGGGMFFTQEHANLLLRDEIVPWFADDFHMALTTYLDGYENYRYLGSLTLHRIQTKGGLLTIFQTDNNMVHPDPQYVTLRPCAALYKDAPNNNYFYPMSTDLTEAAHELHQQNKINKERHA